MSTDRPREEAQRLRSLVKRGTIEDFLDLYRPADATDPDLGQDLLFGAVAQKTPTNRPVIAGRLLDDGADAAWVQSGEVTTLHVLLGQQKHDFEAEAPLLARLLDDGADINRVAPRCGTSLETIGAMFKFSDADIAPFTDALFSWPDLDLLQPGLDGRPVLDNIRRFERPEMLARAEAYLKQRGIDY